MILMTIILAPLNFISRQWQEFGVLWKSDNKERVYVNLT